MSVTIVCLLANFHLTTEGKGKITLPFAFLRARGARSISMGNLRTKGFLQKSQIYLILKLNFGWRRTSTKKIILYIISTYIIHGIYHFGNSFYSYIKPQPWKYLHSLMTAFLLHVYSSSRLLLDNTALLSLMARLPFSRHCPHPIKHAIVYFCFCLFFLLDTAVADARNLMSQRSWGIDSNGPGCLILQVSFLRLWELVNPSDDTYLSRNFHGRKSNVSL